MRITPQKLWAWARRFAQAQRTQPDVLSVYLSGSLLSRSPLLGGLTDIDLVYIWNHAPRTPYEIREVQPGIHLDIRHYARDRFEPARRLRTDPWLGAEVFAAHPLWDPHHFFDRIQAGVRSHFHDPEIAYRRAATLLNQAREDWMSLHTLQDLPVFVEQGLRVLYHAAHVPATLRGYILPPRRFLQAFSVLAQMFQQPNWVGTLLQLLGAPHISPEHLSSWLSAWETDYDLALRTQPVGDPVLHPARKHYYAQGIRALLQDSTPSQALYPLLWTWTRAVLRLPQEKHAAWKEAVHLLGWHQRDDFLQGTDAWLDTLEAFLEAWAREYGVEITTSWME